MVFLYCDLSTTWSLGSNTYPINSAAWITYRVGCSVSLIVYTSYSATLASHLAVEQPVTLPFSNLQELFRQSGWDAGCNNNDLFKQTCVGSQTGECRVLREAWKKVVLRSPDNLVNSYTEGLEKVLNDSSRIKELPVQYITGGIAIGLQKKIHPSGSYLTTAFRRCMSQA
ncbi:uncharacterized protein LOC135108584 isoform X2 [Scylla paramamosain]|uniref:uncharacterized protein LOC135108584 isoform X2 n=1 Tax=Scylla paramamosain TaxID=85552 RepID=UPI003083591D